jgi:hypothetical protein
LILGGTTAAQANLPGSPFDAGDGNLVVNDEFKDWANIGISCVTPIAGCGLDLPTGQTDNSFGTGTKEDTPVPSVVDGSIPNNKSDLTRFYARFVEEANGSTYAYLAWERVQEPNGTTNMDFEFNQSSVLSSNGVTPVRTAGDVLIKYDLSQGGVNPVLGYHTWVATGNKSLCEAANATPCWGKVQTLAGNFEEILEAPSEKFYIRLRGTDGKRPQPGFLGANIDPAGPAIDQPGNADPWEDLWFYTNPIFVGVTS